jgi:hypothetical protein
MAYYYGTVSGGRTRVTRCGTKRSGIAATVAAWGVGVRVSIEHDAAANSDTLILEHIPWRDASDADATGRVLLRIPLGALALKAPEIVDATPALDTMDGRQ